VRTPDAEPSGIGCDQSPDTQLNLDVRGLPPSATVAIEERSELLRRAGRRVFKLGLGQSPFPVPEPVVDALRQNAHRKSYLPVRGLPELREAVARHHRHTFGIGASADDVLVGPGSKELMFLLQLVYYGDLVVPSPAWVSYAPQARILGRHVHTVQTSLADGWRLTPQALDSLCRSDPGRPRIIVLNYPSNPTGTTYTASPQPLRDGLSGRRRRDRVSHASRDRAAGARVLSPGPHARSHEDRTRTVACRAGRTSRTGPRASPACAMSRARSPCSRSRVRCAAPSRRRRCRSRP